MYRALFPVLLAFLGCAPKAAVERIDLLEARVIMLEQQVEDLSKNGRRGGLPSRPTDEQAAAFGEMMDVLRRLSASGNLAEVKVRCAKARAEHAEYIASDAGSRVWLRAEQWCAEASLVGTSAPPVLDSGVRWLNGRPDLKADAQLLVFWEQWCPHCRRELPRVADLSVRFSTEIDVLTYTKMSRGSSEAQVFGFMDEKAISLPVAHDSDGIFSGKFKVRGVPAAAIVKDDTIIWRGHPARLDDDMLRSLLTQ